MLVGKVFKGTVPSRTGGRSLLFRIIRESRGFALLRLTSLPGDPPIYHKDNRIWVEIGDINVLVQAGLAEHIESLTCPDCKVPMKLWDGYRGRQPGVFFACPRCEDTLEV